MEEKRGNEGGRDGKHRHAREVGGGGGGGGGGLDLAWCLFEHVSFITPTLDILATYLQS